MRCRLRPLEEFPDHLIKATLATEDRRFYDHFGIDVAGTFRALITNAQAGSKAGWTPYDGKEVTGWPVGTVIRGRRVMWEGEIVTPGQGRAVEFSEALVV